MYDVEWYEIWPSHAYEDINMKNHNFWDTKPELYVHFSVFILFFYVRPPLPPPFFVCVLYYISDLLKTYLSDNIVNFL